MTTLRALDTKYGQTFIAYKKVLEHFQCLKDRGYRLFLADTHLERIGKNDTDGLRAKCLAMISARDYPKADTLLEQISSECEAGVAAADETIELHAQNTTHLKELHEQFHTAVDDFCSVVKPAWETVITTYKPDSTQVETAYTEAHSMLNREEGQSLESVAFSSQIIAPVEEANSMKRQAFKLAEEKLQEAFATLESLTKAGKQVEAHVITLQKIEREFESNVKSFKTALTDAHNAVEYQNISEIDRYYKAAETALKNAETAKVQQQLMEVQKHLKTVDSEITQGNKAAKETYRSAIHRAKRAYEQASTEIGFAQSVAYDSDVSWTTCSAIKELSLPRSPEHGDSYEYLTSVEHTCEQLKSEAKTLTVSARNDISFAQQQRIQEQLRNVGSSQSSRSSSSSWSSSSSGGHDYSYESPRESQWAEESDDDRW